MLGQIWNWFAGGWSNMADIADKIDDLICSFEGGGDTTMDTVAMLVFGWMIFGLVVLGVSKYVYARFVMKNEDGVSSSSTTVAVPAIATATIAKEDPIAAKDVTVPAAPVVRAAAPRLGAAGGGSFAPTPTPPIRKRVSMSKNFKGSAGNLAGTPSRHPVQPPISTGADSESVQWVNEVFYWLYTDSVTVNEILQLWLESLNEFTNKSVPEQGVGVEFVRILPESQAPVLTNLFSECDSKDDVTITCDCEATPALQIKCYRQKGEKVEVSHYRVNVNRFRARLNIVCITEKLLADVKCDGWPEIKVAMAQVGTIRPGSDDQAMHDLLTDMIVDALRNSTVHVNLGLYPNCPRLSRYSATQNQPGYPLPLHYDSMMATQYPGVAKGTPSPERRLLVKVIKATGLGAKVGCTEPYCVVEMDDPPQKNQTSIKKDTNSPNWDEHFLFDLGPNTAELLFEVYDRSAGRRFLGLGIVGVEELLINPSQRQIISLQSRPYEEDDVSGTLTVEFLFIEGADIPNLGNKPFKLKETLRTVSPTGGVITTTKTVFESKDRMINGGDVVADSALKELERGRPTTQTNKSTLIIHSVQREQPPVQNIKVEQTDSGRWQEVESKQGTGREIKAHPAGETGRLRDTDGGSTTPSSPTDDRTRGRKKRRDFFGTIKRRLGRSKTRSKSQEPGLAEDGTQDNGSLNRSISADRARDPSAHSTGYLSVPTLRGIDINSTRSSLSEASGISGASTRTYINEASTLVLETLENGIKKHYLVPLSMAQRSKWRKKGTKLHIFNDHTFIAKHLPGGTVCQVCHKALARRLGKQGYECRDCEIKCHKHCHIRVDSNCTNSTIQNIELSYITSPLMNKRLFKLQQTDT